MAKRHQFTMSTQQRKYRRFRESFKRAKVLEIEQGLVKVSQIYREYEVTKSSVYIWINKFGIQKDKPEKIIVEMKSDTVKLLVLQKKPAELERVIGSTQLLLDFKDKMIELAEQDYKVDIKKNILANNHLLLAKQR
ncbi:MAG: transposase [Bacteroidetes bacterium]|nr:transposase [Bacteroidota bacterium]